MIIKLTYTAESERVPYVTQTSNDDNIIFSIINSLIVEQNDEHPSGIDPDGKLQLEIKDNNGRSLTLEDKAELHKLYAVLKTTINDIEDLSIFSNDSENLLYSTSMFGYKIVNAGFQDFSLNMDNEEFKDNDKFIFINLILAPNIKEDESEGV